MYRLLEPSHMKRKYKQNIYFFRNWWIYHWASKLDEIYSFGSDVQNLLVSYLFVDYVQTFRDECMFNLRLLFDTSYLVYQTSPPQGIIYQKLVPQMSFLNSIHFKSYVTKYVREMNYFQDFPEIGIWDDNLFFICLFFRTICNHIEWIIIAGFSIEVYYFDVMTNQFAHQTFCLVSQ
jgi:hypothetical protein